MIKRLNLFSNTAENDLLQAFIDKSHQRVRFSYLRKIFKSINDEKYLTNLLKGLQKNLKSSSVILKIKSLISLHYLMRKTLFKNQRIVIFAQNELSQLKSKKFSDLNTTKSKINIENQQKQYIQKNIIEFYIIYLLKFIAHSEQYCEAKITTQSNKDMFDLMMEQKGYTIAETTAQTKVQTVKVKQKQSDYSITMTHINHGFQVINLINFIIQSQQSFNKMGRYYIQHEQILNLFLMYLDDLTVYNDYIKKLAKLLTKKIGNLKQEQVKHCFVYLTQSQKTSDRLYQFYYNRYYYSKVKKMITMPTFLTIDSNDFQRVIKQIKKVDKQLFKSVQQSKYSQQYKHNKTMHCITLPTSHSPSKTSSKRQSKLNQTMMTQSNNRALNHLNKTIQNLRNHSKSKKQIQQNITRYIECLEDIDDEQFL